jgi:hypothetical protein
LRRTLDRRRCDILVLARESELDSSLMTILPESHDELVQFKELFAPRFMLLPPALGARASGESKRKPLIESIRVSRYF